MEAVFPNLIQNKPIRVSPNYLYSVQHKISDPLKLADNTSDAGTSIHSIPLIVINKKSEYASGQSLSKRTNISTLIQIMI